MVNEKAQSTVKSKGRRGLPGLRRRGKRAQVAMRRAQLTVGDLIAAAYDALGSEARAVARVLSSPDLAAAVRRRIVVV